MYPTRINIGDVSSVGSWENGPGMQRLKKEFVERHPEYRGLPLREIKAKAGMEWARFFLDKSNLGEGLSEKYPLEGNKESDFPTVDFLEFHTHPMSSTGYLPSKGDFLSLKARHGMAGMFVKVTKGPNHTFVVYNGNCLPESSYGIFYFMALRNPPKGTNLVKGIYNQDTKKFVMHSELERENFRRISVKKALRVFD